MSSRSHAQAPRLCRASLQEAGSSAESLPPSLEGLFSIANPSSIPGQRLDYVGGAVYASTPEVNLFYLNRAAFAEVPQITASGAPSRPGNLGRNALRLPGAWNLDLGIAKNFHISERYRFQIREIC